VRPKLITTHRYALILSHLLGGIAVAESIDVDPDLILTNGHVVTVDSAFTIVEAVAIHGDRFVGVGTREEIDALAGENTHVIDLRGRTVVPGFIDGHAHMDREGLKFIQPSLEGVRSIDDVLRVVEREVDKKQPGEWVMTMPLGDYPYYDFGPESLVEGRYPTRWDLDRVSPDNPVYIRGIWYSWRGKPPIVSIANSRALELAGVTRETVPPHAGLEIVKDAVTGEPTGVFIEQRPPGTMEFSLMAVAPRFTHEQRVAALRDSMRRYNAVGTTSVYEGHGISSVVLRAYKELWDSGTMTVRSTLTLSPAWGSAPTAAIDELLAEWSIAANGTGIGDDWLTLNGIYAEVGTSPQLEIRKRHRPYPGWAGYGVDQVLSPERATLYELIAAAARANLRVTGDADQLGRYLDAFARLNETIPIADRRFVLMHVDFATDAQQILIKELGIVPTIITTRLWRDGSARTRDLPAERLNEYVPLRSYVDKGIPFVLVTDNTPIQPLYALWAAVARTDTSTGSVIGPEQRISREDALRAFSINGAYLTFDEVERGSIELGKLADLAVLSDDVLSVPEDRIKEIDVLMTIVGGDIVHDSLN
jgi:predicted amidohydrolase YtcJ